MSDVAGSPAAQQPRWLLTAVIVVDCVAAAVMLVVAWVVDGGPRDYVAMVVLGVLSFASWIVRIRLLARVTVAANSIISLASFALVGAFGSALISALSMLAEVGRRPWRVRLFNGAMGAVLGSSGGLVYRLAGGAVDLKDLVGFGPLMLHVGGPVMIAAVAQTTLNYLLLGTVMWADLGGSYRRRVTEMLLTSGLGQVAFGVIGFLFIILWVPAGVGPFSAVLILVPLFVARWAFIQFSEQQEAHERTLAAFVAAAAARDPRALGHSERVARLCEWIAESLALGTQQTTSLRFAAMLHDIGWAGAPVRTGEGGPLRDAHTLVRHPELTVELLQEITFLKESLPGIRHHHERVDGTGYPDGLAGEEIPLAARIIAVADAFDAATTTRGGVAGQSPVEALEVLHTLADSHLDRDVVAALERALGRYTWVGGSVDLGADHDDPLGALGAGVGHGGRSVDP